MAELSLKSAPFVGAPGFIAWAKVVWKGPHANDRKVVKRALGEGWGLKPEIAEGILDGSLASRVEGDKVIVTVPDGVDWKLEPALAGGKE